MGCLLLNHESKYVRVVKTIAIHGSDFKVEDWRGHNGGEGEANSQFALSVGNAGEDDAVLRADIKRMPHDDCPGIGAASHKLARCVRLHANHTVEDTLARSCGSDSG